MKMLVAGASGFVGSALIPFLAAGGHAVTKLVRGPGGWDPDAGRIGPVALEGYDAVIHLGGESISRGRWTAAKKERIRTSRVKSTRVLAEALAGLEQPPKVLLVASATGLYGDRGEEELTESSPPGTGFLAGVCREWETAADLARAGGIRTVHLRTGIVLGSAGGALAKMLTPFKLGMGGRIGPGTQFMSWITIDDLVGAIGHLTTHPDAAGPYNGVAPGAVTNLEFTKTLGRVLGRWTIFPMPASAVRLAFGEMADALLLSSTRVVPERLTASGYRFRHGTLEQGLRHVLGR